MLNIRSLLMCCVQNLNLCGKYQSKHRITEFQTAWARRTQKFGGQEPFPSPAAGPRGRGRGQAGGGQFLSLPQGSSVPPNSIATSQHSQTPYSVNPSSPQPRYFSLSPTSSFSSLPWPSSVPPTGMAPPSSLRTAELHRNREGGTHRWGGTLS